MSSGNLIIIENGHLKDISLEGRNIWEIGRVSKGNDPDIPLRAKNVSRRHGRFQNRDGIWYYLDYNSKNGTMRNNKSINPQRHMGNSWPAMLDEGDTLILGSRGTGLICPDTVWATFTMKHFTGGWRCLDTKNFEQLFFVDGDKTIKQEKLSRGTVFRGTYGMAIYMGDITYLTGNVSVEEANAG